MEKMIIVKSDQVNLNKLGNQIQSQEKCWSKKNYVHYMNKIIEIGIQPLQ